MTLLPGVAISRVVAFLAAFVALNTGLIFSPFVRLRSLVLSFLGTFVVGTWLALRGVELHLLQPVVVVVPLGNVPFGFPVRSIVVSVTASFL
jgi:hypothetical protein